MLTVYANAVADLIALIMLSLLYFSSRHADKTDFGQRLFNALLLAAGILLLSDICGWFLNKQTFRYAHALHSMANAVYFFMQPVYCLLWLLYTKYWVNHSRSDVLRQLPIVAVPLLIFLVFLVANFWNGWIYYVDAQNVYHRGRLFLPLGLVYLFYIVYSAGIALRSCFREPDPARRKQSRYIAVFMVLPVLGAVLQNRYYGVSLVWPFSALSLLMVYLNVQQRHMTAQRIRSIEQERNAAKLESELTNNRISIMLSQIQPHFLFNVLTTIVDLCDTDATLAKSATIAFSQFLRTNMESLALTTPIPFSMERTHVETYTSLEKLRFGEYLHIVWDIGPQSFSLPALSLQPLVENAVKYGVGKKEEGGTVRIATAETADDYIVTVTDDGVGFDPAQTQADGRTHIGIDNVRARIAAMSNGTLTVVSIPNSGTKAEIRIPKEKDRMEREDGT